MRTLLLVPLLMPVLARASDVVEAAPLTDRIVLLHFKDGYVVHHKREQARSDERVVAVPLDTAKARSPGAYKITSADDPAYKKAKSPVAVGRKSKGTDFAWFTDRWVGDHFENDRPDHTKEHWLYLNLPSPMVSGRTYKVSTGDLAANGKGWTILFDERKARSGAVHVNLIGYVPTAPKFAYLYAWAGDQGGIDLARYAGKPFQVVDPATGKVAFKGTVAFRKSATNPETGQAGDTPNANFLGADVYECDFSGLKRSGSYTVIVPGLGCSFPFRVDADVYREPFVTMARGLYHNRSGIVLKKPFTTFERPAPHNPKLTPGFRGKLQYSTMRYLDYGSESGTKEGILPTIKGPLDAWGWYQDAGDWDSYETHLRVAQELMLAYELNPKAFADGELNLPESGNGVPDILDEAAWLPRFCHRLRKELLKEKYGTGGIGLRVAGDAFGEDTKPGGVGQGSWEDVDRTWVVSGEDPVSTFRYAGAAAQFALCLKAAGKADPEKTDWAKEARESYAWALANTKPNDPVKPNRLYAAAALFRLTGEKAYEAQFRADFDPNGDVWFENLYGPAAYALGKGQDPALLAQVRAAILRTADASHDSAAKRALRWGGNFYFPMLVGQQTTPWVMEEAVAWKLTGDAKYRADLMTSCDYFLGTNALNQTWATGLGPRHPNFPFHMDAWYNGKPGPHPGIVPYGPWRKERDQGVGPWDHDWPNKTVYPPIDAWPGNERYFDNRCSPLTGEFTIHQNTAPAAAIFAVLCAPRK